MIARQLGIGLDAIGRVPALLPHGWAPTGWASAGRGRVTASTTADSAAG